MKNTFSKILFLGVLFLLLSCNQENNKTTVQFVAKNDIDRIEPPNWWIGFQNQHLQLLVRHPNIGNATVKVLNPTIVLEKVHQADSKNYLFLDLKIKKSAKAGKFNIQFNLDDKELLATYELKSREQRKEDFVGFNSSDAIYLITPDRFANADESNDTFSTLNEKKIDRKNDYARHGGDIKGITNHLDYIDDLGFTAIWSCPLLINDMPRQSYHGYAITDYYKVDPRFGTFKEYKELADKGRERGIKLIMDQVANHCGLEHWWMKDLPFKDWVNYQEHYEKNKENWNWKTTITSSHRRTVNQDFYASNADKKSFSDGWFVSDMPDLNQRNPFMATYLIQNSIWWVEALKLGGIRQDTYPYPDKQFMSKWAKAIMTEYPNFSIVGEEWSANPLLVAYWQNGKNNKDGYQSNLTSSMDFPMQKTIVDAFNEQETWGTGLIKLYDGLANDFVYPSPKDIMIFPDNHDMSRIFTQLKGDIPKTKMALSYLLTLPRIPQIYYGTEILMNDFKKPGDHGLIRTDFPGGWKGDTTNAFTGDNLSSEQKDMQNYLRKVLNYRKESKAIHNGKTMHFTPENGTYFLFRMLDDEVVVHIINKNKKAVTVDLTRFNELGLTNKTFRNIITDESFIWKDSITLKNEGSTILTTKNNTK